MNKLLAYILIFLTFSCVEKKKESESDKIQVEQKKPISINNDSTELKAEPNLETKDSVFIDQNNFKYSTLNEFDLRGWYYGIIVDSLKSFSSKKKLIEYYQSH